MCVHSLIKRYNGKVNTLHWLFLTCVWYVLDTCWNNTLNLKQCSTAGIKVVHGQVKMENGFGDPDGWFRHPWSLDKNKQAMVIMLFTLFILSSKVKVVMNHLNVQGQNNVMVNVVKNHPRVQGQYNMARSSNNFITKVKVIRKVN